MKMSAFVVEPKTINRVITWLESQCEKRQWIGTRAEEELGKIEFSLDREYIADLGQAMYNLNINAVSQRYPGDETIDTLPGSVTKDGKLMPYKYRADVVYTDLQAMKSLSCWLYQCSEGNVGETGLYKAFERISNLMAHHIITRLPQYDKAEWA